jgi:putative membrane protein
VIANIGGLGGLGIVELLVMLAFWTLIILLVVGLVRGRRGMGAPTSNALRVLKERYARGEIDHDEFMERRRVLLGEPGTTTGGPTP